MNDYESIELDVDGDGIATVTLDRPGVLNAFNLTMRRELIDAFDATDADDNVRAVIVTGRGRAFCAGADLSSGGDTFDFDARAKQDQDGYADGLHRDNAGMVSLRIFESLKPVIAAVNGPAVGAGATIQLPMDARLASTTARIGFVFARRGLVPDGAASWFLPRLVGIPNALEWCYSGRLLSAQEAFDAGLVRSLHEPQDLLAAAGTLARELVEQSAPVSIALTRQLVWRMSGAAHPMHAHRAESRGIQSRGGSPDAREGVTAFLDKRPARFSGQVSISFPDIWSDWDDPPFA